MPVHLKVSSILRKYVNNYDPTEGAVLEDGEGKGIYEIIDELGIPSEKVTLVLVNKMPAATNRMLN